MVKNMVIKYKDIPLTNLVRTYRRDRVDMINGYGAMVNGSDDFPPVLLVHFPLNGLGLYWNSRVCGNFGNPCIGVSKHIDIDDLEEVLVHELQHYIDDIKTKGEAVKKTKYICLKDYYNSWAEINANFSSYVHKYGFDLLNISKFNGYEHLTIKSKKRIINRLVMCRGISNKLKKY